jgi:hypothetical protein
LTGTTSSADITIEIPTGTSQQQGIDVPLYSKDGYTGLRMTGFSPGAFLYISAQNNKEYGG